MNCSSYSLSRIHFFSYSGKYDYIRIDRHTYGQEYTEYSRQCKNSAEQFVYPDIYNYIE